MTIFCVNVWYHIKFLIVYIFKSNGYPKIITSSKLYIVYVPFLSILGQYPNIDGDKKLKKKKLQQKKVKKKIVVLYLCSSKLSVAQCLLIHDRMKYIRRNGISKDRSQKFDSSFTNLSGIQLEGNLTDFANLFAKNLGTDFIFFSCEVITYR